MFKKIKKIATIGALAGAELISPDLQAVTQKIETGPSNVSIEEDVKLEVFRKVNELAPYLTKTFKSELSERGCEKIDIFPGIGEDKELVIEIVFMGRSENVMEIDPKTNEVIGPGLESLRIVPVLVDKITAGNKYLLQEYLANIVRQTLKED